MPSVRFCARPSGNTSTSLAVKSVSRAEVAAYNTTRTGPMTSTSLRRGAVVYTSTSRRCSTARWSFGPQGNTFGLQEHSTDKPVGSVVAVRRTGVWWISVVAVGAYWRSGNVSWPESDSNTDLGLGVGQRNHQNCQQGHIL